MLADEKVPKMEDFRKFLDTQPSLPDDYTWIDLRQMFKQKIQYRQKKFLRKVAKEQDQLMKASNDPNDPNENEPKVIAEFAEIVDFSMVGQNMIAGSEVIITQNDGITYAFEDIAVEEAPVETKNSLETP